MAVRRKASDLFLWSEEHDVRFAARLLGQVELLATLDREMGQHLINHIKSAAGMDLAQKRRPQEGRWVVELDGHSIDLRINIVPTLHGEDVAVRVFDRRCGLLPLDDVGLTRSDLNRLTGLLASPSGLLLVTGPTGTGKTTTIYSCLQYLHTGSRKINTIEDPVEYALSGIRQSQINPRSGPDYSDLLKHVLRQGPDVIMIGEIRDEETVATAIRAANSGHLVLTTLHAPRAAGAIPCLRALGANLFFLSSCLLGILAQRLVRTLCPDCRVAYDIRESPESFTDINNLMESGLGAFIFGPGGCHACHGQGYRNRTGIFELMTFSRTLRQMVISERDTQHIQEEAIRQGMVEFRRNALLKVAQGFTSIEEILRVLPPEQLGLES